MGFFEWAVLLLLSSISLHTLQLLETTEDKQFMGYLPYALFLLSVLMTVWHIGGWVWSLFS